MVIEGLKLTMTGAELKAKLEERIRYQGRRAAHYAELLEAATEESEPPAHVLRHEVGEAHSRLEALTLIRDHIIADEVYRLGEIDLQFADLLPEPDLNCGCLDRVMAPGIRSMPGLFDDDGDALVGA